MAGNTTGDSFRVTTYGESHGQMVGAVIDGCPSKLELDLEKIKKELKRRQTGQSKVTSQRKESDIFYIGSGVMPQEKEANAHLISAAPDMYEALKEAMSCYLIDGTHMRILQDCLYMFEKALDKAEGKGAINAW